MGKIIIEHIDEAPWTHGGPPGRQQGADGGQQFIGDYKTGPWIHINWVRPGLPEGAPHSHSEDETMIILEGQFSMGRRECGPGTVIFIPKNTQYTFKVGPQGVRFINIRSGLAKMIKNGQSWDPYAKFGTKEDPFSPAAAPKRSPPAAKLLGSQAGNDLWPNDDERR